MKRCMFDWTKKQLTVSYFNVLPKLRLIIIDNAFACIIVTRGKKAVPAVIEFCNVSLFINKQFNKLFDISSGELIWIF